MHRVLDWEDPERHVSTGQVGAAYAGASGGRIAGPLGPELPGRERRWLLLILFAATALQAVGLTQESLWMDELFSVWASDADTLDTVISRLRSDVHLPLYQILLWAWIQVFGNSELAVRGLSALMGIAANGAFFLGCRRLYGLRFACLATALFAACYTTILYGRTVRPYEWMLLLSTVFTFSWLGLVLRLRAPAGPGARLDWRDCGAFAASALMACATHYYGALLVGVASLYLLILAARPEARDLRFATWALVLGAGLSCLAVVGGWLSMSIGLMGKVAGNFWIESPRAVLAARLGKFFAGTYGTGLIIFPVLVVAMQRLLARRNDPRRVPRDPGAQVLRACFFLVAGGIGIAVTSSFVVPTVTPRNLIVLLPAFWVLFAMSICRAFEAAVAVRVLVGVAALSLVGSVTSLAASVVSKQMSENEQPRDAIEFVGARLGGEPALELLANRPAGDAYPYWAYYQQRSVLRGQNLNAHDDVLGLEAAARAALAQGRPVGMMIGFLRSPAHHEFFTLKASFRQTGCELWEGHYTFALACRPAPAAAGVADRPVAGSPGLADLGR